MGKYPSVRPHRLPKGTLAVKPGGRTFVARGDGWAPLSVDTGGVAGMYTQKRRRSDLSSDGAGAGAGVGGAGGAGAGVGGTGGAGGAGGAGGGTEGGRPKRARPSEAVLAFIGDMTDEEATIKAAREGRVDVLEHLHAKGVDFSARDNGAAIWAAGNGHLHALEFLEGKPGVNFGAYDNWAAIWAAEGGHLHVLKFLERKGVNFSSRDNQAAIWAASNGHLHVLEFLKGKLGVDFSAQGNKAAVLAAEHGHLHVLEFLEGKLGVDFSAQGDYAANLAAERQHLRVLEFLAKQPHVRMAAFLRRVSMHTEWCDEREAWEEKQDAFVAMAKDGRLTADDVDQAQRDKLIFRELERDGRRELLDPAVRKLVDAQIAEEHNEVAWRSSRPLLAHWSDHRESARARDGNGRGAGGSKLFETWKNLPRAAVAEVLMQRHGGEW